MTVQEISVMYTSQQPDLRAQLVDMLTKGWNTARVQSHQQTNLIDVEYYRGRESAYLHVLNWVGEHPDTGGDSNAA